MFGLSFGELCVLLMVAMVVLGPKELPRYLRKAGQWTGRLRRIAFEMREKSGIDEVLRSEGLDREIAEFRKLARGELMGVSAAVRSLTERPLAQSQPASPYAPSAPPESVPSSPGGVAVYRERELPGEGADSYGALPDTAVVYEGSLAPSPLAGDALYMRGTEEAPTPAPSASAEHPTPPTASASTPPTSA